MSGLGLKKYVMATPWVRSRSGVTRYRPAPRNASEFVRDTTPSRTDSYASLPLSRILNSSRCVPHVPAANTR